MDEFYNLYDWAFCLTGVMGLLYYFSRTSDYMNKVQSYIAVFKRKGIYNPSYGMTIAIVYAILDIVISVVIYKWFYNDYWTDSDFILAQMGRLILPFLVVLVSLHIFLPKIDNRHLRKTFNSIDYHKMGLAMAAFVIVCVSVEYWLKRFVYGMWYGEESASLIATLAVVSSTLWIAWSMYISLNRYELIKDASERTLSALTTRHAPIVFLRSFALDKPQKKGMTFDEYICSTFALNSQPIISLSDPDDFLPTGGSIKIQSMDEEWENAINTLLMECRAVVIFEGKSESLKTEMGKIQQFHIPHDKVFVATPPQKYRLAAWNEGQITEKKHTLNFIWSNFVKALEVYGGMHGLPQADPGECMIYSFDEHWNCKPSPVKKKGNSFLGYIVDQTVAYENDKCDYLSLSRKLKRFELQHTQMLTKDEKKQIENALVKVSVVSTAVVLAVVGLIKILAV